MTNTDMREAVNKRSRMETGRNAIIRRHIGQKGEYGMSWNLDSDRPIFMQIIEHIELDIVSGKLPPGSRVASVRELSSEASVNPNTMQRALGELERMGLMRTDRTVGRYITDDEAMIGELKARLAEKKTGAYLEDMARLGIKKDEIIGIINKNGKP